MKMVFQITMEKNSKLKSRLGLIAVEQTRKIFSSGLYTNILYTKLKHQGNQVIVKFFTISSLDSKFKNSNKVSTSKTIF